MNYTLHQLRIYAEVCRTKSITRAAERLHLTQPAVSIQLKNLQDQFEVPLTELIGRRLHITDFGQKIFEAVERILEETNSIAYTQQAFKGVISGKLRFSSVSTGKYLLPYLLAPFLEQNKGIELNMDVTNRRFVLDDLSSNKVDFALMSLDPEFETDSLPLTDNAIYLAGSKEIVERIKENPASINDMQFIFREQGSATRAAMSSFMEKNKLPLTKRLELTSNEAIKQALMAGLGVSVISLVGIVNELKSDRLRIIPFDGLPIRTTWKLYWLKKKKLSPAALAFIEFLKKDKDKIILEKFGSMNIR